MLKKYFKCVKEFHSKLWPDEDFGKLDTIYELDNIVTSDHFSEGYFYLRLIGLGEDDLYQKTGLRGLMNSERFEEVSPWDVINQDKDRYKDFVQEKDWFSKYFQGSWNYKVED